MSGVIPASMEEPDEIPYCIWRPDVPSEDTLRALIQRYPNVIYHAARACAVAGYISLYKELSRNILPEVHVAEEACHASAGRNVQGSEEIYQHIMAHGVKYAVMDDYQRTVNISNPRVISLNGDTAVYSNLAARQAYKDPGPRHSHSTSHYFNITEDWGLDDHDCGTPQPPADFVPLLYAPLPTDLPPINKDMLILLAAYHGNIDRYARLRRPKMVEFEQECIIYGIHHNII